MPKWGLTMTAGTVTGWLYDEGAEISEGDPIFTVETEKAVNDVEAPADGVLVKIVAIAGRRSAGQRTGRDHRRAGRVDHRRPDLRPLIADASPKKPRPRRGRRCGAAPRRREPPAATPAAESTPRPPPADARRNSASTSPRSKRPGPTAASPAMTSSARRPQPAPIRRRAKSEITLGRRPGAHRPARGQRRRRAARLPAWPRRLASTWQVVLGDLVDRHRVAAIDLPGHGASDKSADGRLLDQRDALAVIGSDRQAGAPATRS